ncbi:protein-glutamate methylesterase/protein-glutamine glutaminase [Lacticigenium naphthae]|uniref:protein-glutamate methylesterase/protein-glutamine glutaminase n=1 Tax=Lacticigenium naphthae TaxID=515351 RepID=UPI0003F8E031|nr:chemotaxis response regulator protein-glutamate methylesterase [Lacticigenium naphthae]
MDRRVLVVDDSAFMRKIFTHMIEEMNGFTVVASARDGIQALEKVAQGNIDLITLDVEMPRMNGLETLKQLKESQMIPTIMLSSKSNEDITIEALEAGALDFIEKPQHIRKNWEGFKDELAERMHSIFEQEKVKSVPKQFDQRIKDLTAVKGRMNLVQLDAIAIGASTGGPKALITVIKGLPASLAVPVFIVQHMPEGFTASFATRLDAAAKVPVVEATQAELIEKGKVYLAPGGKHMEIENGRISLTDEEKILGVRPAVNPLFQSAAQTYKKGLLGIVLTGMGQDGAEGTLSIHQNGGTVFSQDQASCVIYGMPKNAVEKGWVDETISLQELPILLNDLLGG